MTNEQLQGENDQLLQMVEQAERMAELMKRKEWRRQFGHQSPVEWLVRERIGCTPSDMELKGK